MSSRRTPWNKGKLIGQKAPLKLSEIWSTRVRLHLAGDFCGLALFSLGIDSKLRGCELPLADQFGFGVGSKPALNFWHQRHQETSLT